MAFGSQFTKGLSLDVGIRDSDATFKDRMKDPQAAKNARAERTPPEAYFQTLKNSPWLWIGGAILVIWVMRKFGR